MNRKTLLIALLVCLLAAILAIVRYAPQKRQDDAAIRTALQNYLSQKSGLNMAAMDMDIKSVKTEGDHATAQVEFRAKQGGGAMQMTYQFERQGDAWVVQGSSGTAGSGHPAIPEGGMPPSGQGGLPAGHPPISPMPAAPPVHGTGNPPPETPTPKP